MQKITKLSTSLDEPLEKRELGKTISAREKTLNALIDEIEQLKIDLTVIKQGYDVKVGRRYLKLKDLIDKYFSLTYERNGATDILERVGKFYTRKKFDICLVILEELLSRENNNLDAKIWKAAILQKQGKYPEAVRLFTECLSIEKGYAFVWRLRGGCYRKILDKSASERLDPGTEQLRKWVKETDDYKNALSDYLQVIELDPTNGAAYDDAAMCYCIVGDYNKAHEFIDKAFTLSGAETPMIRKAQFFEFQEKIAESQEQYKKTLDKFPNSKYAKKEILRLTK